MPSRILRLWNPSLSAWEEVGDSRLSTHLAAADPHPGYVLEGLVDAKGDLLGATGDNTPARLAVGTNGQVLTADSAQTLGLRWATPSAGGSLATDPLADAKGDLFAASADNAIGRLALGTNGQVLTADSTQALGVKWAAAGAGGALPTTGGTMTGTITADGTATAVQSGGALVVTGAVATDYRTYATTPAFTDGSLFTEHGLAFTPASAAYLMAVRWYRTDAQTNKTPASVRLWDTTATGSPVWQLASTPPPFSDTATGWKEYRLPAGTQPALVAGRGYVVSFTRGANSLGTYLSGYTPTPDAGISGVGNRFSFTGGAYPSSTTGDAFGIDAVLRASAASAAPAASGAVRLPNGTAGAVAWRNAGDSADLALTVDATNALTFGGSALLTQTGADARYLALTGGTLSGGLTTQAGITNTGGQLLTVNGSVNAPALAFSTATGSGLYQPVAGQIYVGTNQTARMSWAAAGITAYLGLLFAPDNANDIGAAAANRPRNVYAGTAFIGPGAVPTGGAAGQVLAKNSATAYDLSWTTPLTLATADGRYLPLTGGTLSGGLTATGMVVAQGASAGLQFRSRDATAPAGYVWYAAGGTAHLYDATRGADAAAVGPTGTLSLFPDAGQPSLVGGNPSDHFRISAAANAILFTSPAAIVGPANDGSTNLGSPGGRWGTVYAATGTIQTSSAGVKEQITPLDPAACARAVLDTDWVAFEYAPPPLSPGPPGETVAQSTARVTAHSRSVQETAAARKQNGYVLGSPGHRVSDLFGLSDRESASPQADLGVVACALQDALRRIAALEGAPA